MFSPEVQTVHAELLQMYQVPVSTHSEPVVTGMFDILGRDRPPSPSNYEIYDTFDCDLTVKAQLM